MHLKNKVIVLSFVFCLLSCRKPEIPVEPMDRGDVVAASVNMGADYKEQLFFSLSENRVVSSNLKTDWDLAFDCSSRNCIRVNSSKLMSVYKTGFDDFSDVTDTSGYAGNKKFDYPTGNPDSTAFGSILSNSFVYIVDRGYNSAGIHLGFRKLQVLSAGQNEYKIRVAYLNGSNEVQATIQKETKYNFVHFSFNTNAAIFIEPEKENYDLQFSQYTHLYFNPFEPYLVTGVLLNSQKVKVALVQDKMFADIVLSDTASHPFRFAQNSIGFDWKTYSFQTSSYVVDDKRCFIIRDAKGFYYKLHFVDFYNSSGIKGFPTFEYKKL